LAAYLWNWMKGVDTGRCFTIYLVFSAITEGRCYELTPWEEVDDESS
jgi:hypothetical protein